MIDLNWIIEQENKLTDRARFDLGDNYHLSIDLLKLLQCIESFSVKNEMAHVFDAQILKGFHLVILNTIRRHSTEANLILRFTLESLVLFVYSMEHLKEDDFGIIRNGFQIIDFDEKVKEKAYKHIASKYPDYSKDIQILKDIINTFYSHSNPISTQYNADIRDGSLKASLFDSYVDDSIREVLLCINSIIINTLRLFIQLKSDYPYIFHFKEDFEKQFNEIEERQEKLFKDTSKKYEGKEFWNDSKLMNKILDKIKENENSQSEKTEDEII